MHYVHAADRSCDSGSSPFPGVETLTAFILSLSARAGPPAASRTGSNAAPAFVQLGVVGADVIPYIP